MNVSVIDLKGAATGEVEVGFDIVEGDKGEQAVHDAVVAHMAAVRTGTACAKTRGDKAATKKKPWRQKGTGRARAGSTVSPIWVGGGVVHGPRPRDFTKKINKTTRRLALRKALSERLKMEDVIVVDSLSIGSHKTQDFVNTLETLNINDKTVLVVAETEKNVALAVRNIPHVALTTGEELDTYNTLKFDKLLISRSALETVSKRLAK
ncbi:MAG: 50S ribosomal protein L4 [Verrucomicrobiia bacterium]|jgi:large subunit ribosomal protein L4